MRLRLNNLPGKVLDITGEPVPVEGKAGA